VFDVMFCNHLVSSTQFVSLTSITIEPPTPAGGDLAPGQTMDPLEGLYLAFGFFIVF